MLVTHYQRLLNYIVPDYVHVMDEGRIVKTGGKELALELEERGYEGIEADAAAAPRRPQRSAVVTVDSIAATGDLATLLAGQAKLPAGRQRRSPPG